MGKQSSSLSFLQSPLSYLLQSRHLHKPNSMGKEWKGNDRSCLPGAQVWDSRAEGGCRCGGGKPEDPGERLGSGAPVPVHPLHSWRTGINGLVYSGPQIIGREHHGEGLPESARYFPSDRHSLETPMHVWSDPRLPGEDSTAHLDHPRFFAPPTRPDLMLPSLTRRVYGTCNPCQA